MGGLAFDCEVSVTRGGQRQFTEYRVAAGQTLSDHSFSLPRIFTLEGGVSEIAQPQNIGRPGSSILGGFLDIGLGKLEALTGIDFQDRIGDFETRIQALIDRGEELEIVSKVIGRKRCVLLDWTATTTPEEGGQAIFRVTLKEVLRAGLTIANATEAALAKNGSGGAPSGGGGGPSTASPAPTTVTP